MGIKIGKIFKTIAGPLIDAAGKLIGGHSAKKQQEKANEQNLALQHDQQDWEANMSNTSYQRATQDLLAAGLNPMLAYSQGGASTPNVSAATVQPETGEAEGLKAASSSVSSAMMLKAQLQQMQATTAKTVADTESTNIDNQIKSYDQLYAAANSADRRGIVASNEREAKAKADEAVQRVKNLIQEYERGKQDLEQKRAIQTAVTEAAKWDAALKMYQVPQAKSSAKFYDTTGETSFWTKLGGETARTLKEIFK